MTSLRTFWRLVLSEFPAPSPMVVLYKPGDLRLLVICSVLVLLLSWPGVLYVAALAGVSPVNVVDSLGVEIRASDGWFPVRSSKGVFGRLLGESSEPPSVYYHRLDSPWELSSEVRIVTRERMPARLRHTECCGMTIAKGSWGTAYVYALETPNRVLIYVPELELQISGGSARVLAVITPMAPSRH